MKKTALTTGAVMILGKGIGLAAVIGPSFDSPWTEYEITKATPTTIVGTGDTEEKALADFDKKFDNANLGSKVVDEAPKQDITMMTRVFKVANHSGVRPSPVPATPPATGYTVTGTFHKDDFFTDPPTLATQYRIIKWE
jgi:hypothetical protein